MAVYMEVGEYKEVDKAQPRKELVCNDNFLILRHVGTIFFLYENEISISYRYLFK